MHSISCHPQLSVSSLSGVLFVDGAKKFHSTCNAKYHPTHARLYCVHAICMIAKGTLLIALLSASHYRYSLGTVLKAKQIIIFFYLVLQAVCTLASFSLINYFVSLKKVSRQCICSSGFVFEGIFSKHKLRVQLGSLLA